MNQELIKIPVAQLHETASRPSAGAAPPISWWTMRTNEEEQGAYERCQVYKNMIKHLHNYS